MSLAGSRLWNLCELISKRVLYFLVMVMRGNHFHEISSSEINVNKLNLSFTDDQENQEQDAYKVRELVGYLGNKLSLSMNLY